MSCCSRRLVAIEALRPASASDGTDTPSGLVRAAAEAGLDVVAITDHDTASGWAEATEAAQQLGIDLVRGMEITADVADSSRSVIVEQVTNGVAVRMAVLYLLLSGSEPDSADPATTPEETP